MKVCISVHNARFIQNRLRPENYMVAKRKAKGLRKIDGRTFGVATRPLSKTEAKKSAMMVRQTGRLARVLPNKDGTYQVYVSNSGTRSDIRTVNRDYYAPVPSGINALISVYGSNPNLGKLQRKKSRGFFARLFGGGNDRNNESNLAVARSEELDIQQIQDYKKILKQLEARPDLASLSKDEQKQRAEALALQLRNKREEADEKEKRLAELQREAEAERERLATLEWDKQVQTYNEPFQVREIVKYNSLEIASTSTGALTGWGIATLMGSTAFPIVPIGAGVGYLAAKAARPNILGIGSITEGVLNAADWVEKDLITDSIRVSGGFEKEKEKDGSYKLDSKGRKIRKFPSRGTGRTLGQLRVPKRKKPEEVLKLTPEQTKRFKAEAKRRKRKKS